MGSRIWVSSCEQFEAGHTKEFISRAPPKLKIETYVPDDAGRRHSQNDNRLSNESVIRV